MFEDYSKVNEFFLNVRKIILANKLPRRIEVAGHLYTENNEIKYKEFEESFEGIIESYKERFNYFDNDMLELWEEYKEFNKTNK